MPSTADRPPSALSSPSSGRRIISRLTSSFASKPRSIIDYYIHLDDQHKQFSPGDIVTGSVRLRLSKPVRVQHLVVCLHGFVQVFKNPGSPGEGFRSNSGYTGAGRGSKSGEYFGNGFASLFEDEVVLCGDGRLAEGSYQFNFELEFPDRELPSSIDFERGTVTYMVTATMTRPTTITPTMTCDRKVYFVERIDISPLYPPKPRTITLEPIAKRSRAKHQARKLVDPAERKSRKTDSTQQCSEPQRDSNTPSAASMHVERNTPLSPAPSEISFDSATSSNGRTSQPDSASLSPGTSDTKANQSKSSLGSKSITVTVESLSGGCLRGDFIPIKVNISHTKHIKSLYGVILTLYRQARVDMHPAIPLGPTEKGGKKRYEDYYPKSVTGLGGLSLSGAGSSHAFRKDLSQAMHPLIIDPSSLSTEVNAKVRVPEDLFPTISTVPGGMISFKYFVEVIIDIQGKLAGQDRSLGNLGGFAATSLLPSDGFEGERSAFTPYGSTIIDTTPIRRDKSVIVSLFEVVIGTRDSDRRRGKRKLEAVAQPEPAPVQTERQHDAEDAAPGAHENHHGRENYEWYDQRYQATPTQRVPQPDAPDYYNDPYRNATYDHPPPEIPIPQMQDESELSEKQRMRLAETRLLPSQPPGLEEQALEGASEPTAPLLLEEEHMTAEPTPGPSAPVYSPTPAAPPALPQHESTNNKLDALPIAATPDYISAEASDGRVTDDKREIQRQYLQMEASAPPLEDDDAGPATAPDEPSAPVFDEAEENVAQVHDSHAEATGFSSLPRYER